MSNHLSSVFNQRVSCLPMTQLSRSPDHPISASPPGLFPAFIANKALIQFHPWVILASRLRHAWVTLG